MQGVFLDCLKAADATPQQAEDLAAMLMLFNKGIRVSSRRRLPDAEHLQAIAAVFRLMRGAIA